MAKKLRAKTLAEMGIDDSKVQPGKTIDGSKLTEKEILSYRTPSVVRTTTSKPFFMLSNAFVDIHGKRLTAVEFSIYVVLERLAGSSTNSAFPSLDHLACNFGGLSRPTVIRVIKDLQAKGYISVIKGRHQTLVNGQTITIDANEYILHDLTTIEAQFEHSQFHKNPTLDLKEAVIEAALQQQREFVAKEKAKGKVFVTSEMLESEALALEASGLTEPECHSLEYNQTFATPLQIASEQQTVTTALIEAQSKPQPKVVQGSMLPVEFNAFSFYKFLFKKLPVNGGGSQAWFAEMMQNHGVVNLACAIVLCYRHKLPTTMHLEKAVKYISPDDYAIACNELKKIHEAGEFKGLDTGKLGAFIGKRPSDLTDNITLKTSLSGGNADDVFEERLAQLVEIQNKRNSRPSGFTPFYNNAPKQRPYYDYGQTEVTPITDPYSDRLVYTKANKPPQGTIRDDGKVWIDNISLFKPVFNTKLYNEVASFENMGYVGEWVNPKIEANPKWNFYEWERAAKNNFEGDWTVLNYNYRRAVYLYLRLKEIGLKHLVPVSADYEPVICEPTMHYADFEKVMYAATARVKAQKATVTE